jgi:microcompartment protein CcmL/EutN
VDPALGLIETGSIARGMVDVDAMVKKAPVRVVDARTVSPGKFLVVVAGGVAEVEEAMGEGIAVAGTTLMDQLFLPAVHDQVPMAMEGAHLVAAADIDAIAIIETHTVASAVRAADAACKVAHVRLLSMKLGQGLGGKAFFVMTGELYDLEAAVEAAEELAGRNMLMAREIVPRPHPDFLAIYGLAEA